MILLPALAFASTDSWPAGPGVEIGHAGEPGHLPGDVEPSGAVWHPRRQKLVIVSDSGQVSEMDPLGGPVTTWEVGGDLEGITLADPASDLVYVGVEHPDGVLEFDLAAGAPTGNSWDLTDWMDGSNNLGLEALTWVDGLFFAGLQQDGRIFVFDLLPGGEVQYLDSFASPGGRNDLSGMHYDRCVDVLFAIYDQYNVIVEMSPDGTVIREYELAGDNQEGVALIGGSTTGQTTIFLAEDSGEVWRYEGYPIEPCQDPAPVEEPGPRLQIGFNCFPNPFNPMTRIQFTLPRARQVRLGIFTPSGRLVTDLLAAPLGAGSHAVTWDGRDDRGRPVSSGVYVCSLAAGDFRRTARLVLIR